MTCQQCAVAGDLEEAGHDLLATHPHSFSDPWTSHRDIILAEVYGRSVFVILGAAVAALHAQCRGCTCQHRTSHAAPQS